MIAAIACLALIQPYETEVRAGMPGNASEFRFEGCRVEDFAEGRTINIQAYARARQNVCKWGRCVTVWSHTSRVMGMALVDQNCGLKEVRVWTTPHNPVLDPLIPQVEDAVWGGWAKVKERHPEVCP